MNRRRFFALRTVSTLLKILSFLTIVLAIISAVIYALAALNSGAYVASPIIQVSSSGPAATVLTVVGIIIGGLIAAVILYAYANVIDALISVEENSRRTNELLEALVGINRSTAR